MAAPRPGPLARFALALTATAVAVLVASCHEKSPTGPTTGQVSQTITAVGLKILGVPTASIGVGQSVPLRAAQLLSNGATSAISSGAIWTSSLQDVASVGGDGLLIAKSVGTATVTATYLNFTATATVRVAANWVDLDFRVAILNSTGVPKSAGDVQRIFNKANDLMFERTGSRMRLMDMQDVLFDTASRIATIYMESLTGELPDGVLIWSRDDTATSFGGYAITVTRPAPYSNRFPPTAGSNRLYVANVHYDHKYSRCGYDTTGEIRISDKSANGECRNTNALTCVDNGHYWQCPNSLNDLYSQPDFFIASTVVHEFMHPAGTAGNDDHYSTSTCAARIGLSSADSSDLAKSQWNLGMCPDVFLRFRPAGVPNLFQRR